MTDEETFARKDGPALSVARHMHETGGSLTIGRSWKVDVVAISGQPESSMLEVSVYPFNFETRVTSELLREAERLKAWVLRRRVAAPHLPTWYVVENDMILYPIISPKEGLLTEDDLRASVDRFSKVEQDIRKYPGDLWILYYLAKNWSHHIPPEESQDYYRGETHGFRLTLTSIDTLFACDNSDAMTMLGIVHVFLAGVSAKSYFKRCPELVLETGDAWADAMPAPGGFHRLDPFQISPAEAAHLASSIDAAVAQTPSHMSSGALKVLRSYEHVIPSNDTVNFYRGLTHALQVSVRSIRLFDQFPLAEDSARLPANLESGTAQMSYMAAQAWLAQQATRPF